MNAGIRRHVSGSGRKARPRLLVGGSLLALAGLCPGAALAQNESPPAPIAAAPQDETEIVVTGSYIRGTPENAALPVLVLTADELERRGSPSMLELIKSLPVSGPVLGDSNQFTTAAQFRIGGGTINLRGLGAQRTLVLINGRRMMYGIADTNMLPISAIGRVEILLDGAAATYGSDAIGGVANFITRRDLDGFDVGGQYRYVPGSNGDYEVHAAYGWQGNDSNILIAAGYQHRSELSVLDRDWSYLPRDVNPTSYSILGNPGIIVPVNAFGLPTAGGLVRDSNCAALGGEDAFGPLPVCTFAFAPYLNLVEREDRFQVYGEVNAGLSDSVRFHLEALYAYNNTPALRSSPGYPPLAGPFGPNSIGVFSAPISNPGAVTALQQAGLTPAQIAATSAVSLFFWRPFATGGNPLVGGAGGASSQREYTLFRISTALEGDITDRIEWRIAGTYARDTAFAQTPDVLIGRLQAALNGFGGPNCTGATPGANGCQYFNPFSNAIPGNPALGLTNPGFVSANANSAELNSWLFDDILQRAVSNYWIGDAVISGRTGINLPGGEIGFAIGGQYRYLNYDYDPLNDNSNAQVTPCPTPGQTNCAFRTGPFIFQGQTVPARLSENVYAAFAELSIPLTDRIDAQAAIRYEDYGGLTGSTTNPKFAARWRATDWLTLRGSIGTTFRGPAPGNRAAGGTTGLTGIAAAGNAFKAVDFFGNPAVGPEQAFTYSVGAIVETGGLRLIVDHWSYEVDDQIVTVPANIIATAVAGIGNGTQTVDCASPLRSLITFTNNNACVQGVTVGNDIARVRSDTTNGPTVRTSGIDVTLNYRFDEVLGGNVELGANVSFVLRYKQDAFIYNGITVTPAYDALGFANYDRLPGTIPDWRGMFYAQYSNRRHTLRATLHYVDGVTDNRGPTVIQTGVNAAGCTLATASAPGCQLITFGQQIDAFASVDLNYTFRLREDFTLSLGVQNLFDADPSPARLELSYDPFIGNPYGRTLEIGIRKTF